MLKKTKVKRGEYSDTGKYWKDSYSKYFFLQSTHQTNLHYCSNQQIPERYLTNPAVLLSRQKIHSEQAAEQSTLYF